MTESTFFSSIKEITHQLKSFILKTEFKGYDPYDGLNTDKFFFQLLKKNRFFRLFMIQFNKRLVFNIRSIFGIQPDINSKALALFLSGNLKLDDHKHDLNSNAMVLDLIKKAKSNLYPNFCWGYYFPWQSRVFYQPAHTPNIIVTSFVCNALLDLYEEVKSDYLIEMVKSSIQFFLSELNLFRNESGVCFSYSPKDKSVIYNASAMGLELIARYQYLTKENISEFQEVLHTGINFLKVEQNADGSWYYGKHFIQHFIDHYHTAYLLTTLENIRRYSNNNYDLEKTINSGFDFYINNLFTDCWAPKFYKTTLYPVESHCSGAAIKTLCLMSDYFGKEAFEIAIKVAKWTIENMYDKKNGYFYYQKRKYWTNKINYLRWSQAWMFIGLSYLLYYANKQSHSID